MFNKQIAKLKTATSISVFIAGVMFSSVNYAEVEGTVHLGTADVSTQQVIELLSPNAFGAPKTRGLRLHKSDTPDAQTVAAVSSARALSLEVYFAFDSADLTQEAKQQLAPVGEALASNELANVEFTLEGHTDASGDEGYNMNLSELRAQSVRNYFVERYNLEAERVAARGKGESEIIPGVEPTSGVNRRVTIIAQ